MQQMGCAANAAELNPEPEQREQMNRNITDAALTRASLALSPRLYLSSTACSTSRIDMTETIEFPSESHADGRIVDKRAGKVDIEQLLKFIFPRSLQHPLSTGRLYAFGMYGPLDENGHLRAGHNCQRVVSAWEIDTMCLHFEREDILQVYISSERPLFVLSEAQKEEVIAQADSHLKTVKGRGYRRQVTRDEVSQLLSGTPRDPETGFVSLHDAQKVIMAYRDKQIARFKITFPDPVPRGGPAGGAKASRSKKHKSSSRRPRKDGLTQPTETECGEISGEVLQGSLTKGGSRSFDDSFLAAEGRGRCHVDMGVRRRPKFSADVAPAEMFIKNAGFSPAGIANRTSKLLNTRAYKVGYIADGNDLGLTQNVRLIREDRPLPPGRFAWDPYACVRGKNIGAHVKSARSSTTAKRKA